MRVALAISAPRRRPTSVFSSPRVAGALQRDGAAGGGVHTPVAVDAISNTGGSRTHPTGVAPFRGRAIVTAMISINRILVAVL